MQQKRHNSSQSRGRQLDTFTERIFRLIGPTFRQDGGGRARGRRLGGVGHWDVKKGQQKKIRFFVLKIYVMTHAAELLNSSVRESRFRELITGLTFLSGDVFTNEMQARSHSQRIYLATSQSKY